MADKDAVETVVKATTKEVEAVEAVEAEPVKYASLADCLAQRDATRKANAKLRAEEAKAVAEVRKKFVN